MGMKRHDLCSMQQTKRRRTDDARPPPRTGLLDLPEELILMIIRFITHIPSQNAMQRTCTTLCAAVESVPVRQLVLSTRALFGQRMITPHYSKDLQHLMDATQKRRLLFLHRLTLIVNTPSFCIGYRQRVQLPTGQHLRSLRHFALESTLSRQLHSRLPISGPALTRMMRLMPNLLTLSISDVPNLANGFFGALRQIRGLRTLSLTRCGMPGPFASQYGAFGCLTGRWLPADITYLKLDLLNLDRAIVQSLRSDRLFLSAMQNLVELELDVTSKELATDMWYALRSIDAMGRNLQVFRSRSQTLCSLFEFAKEILGGPTQLEFKVHHLTTG